ncbi:SET domain-containing protein [Lysobacter sp. S4-A87]|uniref:SET domain-containing protein n=1 Tax=Lysobacter sp. S4-A87 TaxID=2925843 RepID=UPI001F533795|nr:SET domain-containing protein [Lysobacter sp. S4-A87]UNK49534.1 SET domain-containing protein [Lysobacter sp. S4-A87]
MTIDDIDLLSTRLLGGAPCLPTVTDAVVRDSAIHGRGLYSTRTRGAGEVLCVLDGQVVDVAAFPGIVDALEWNALGPSRLLVRGIRTSYGYINHSATPNVAIDADGRTMRTCEAVAAGGEFTMDYLAQPVPAGYRDSDEGRRLR